MEEYRAQRAADVVVTRELMSELLMASNCSVVEVILSCVLGIKWATCFLTGIAVGDLVKSGWIGFVGIICPLVCSELRRSICAGSIAERKFDVRGS